MKKIALFLVLITIFSCSKSVSQVSAIKSIAESSEIKLPYGDKGVLHDFPVDWNSSKENFLQDSLYNKLSIFLFQDIENPVRKVISTNYSETKSLLAKEFIPSEAVKSNKEKLEIRTAKIFSFSDLSVFSILYQGKMDCKTCEYPERQTQNILVSIKQGKVIDKLLVSYINGSDLGQATRYFYIDPNSIIHIKDFKSDEEGVTFSGCLKYKINPEGKFLKQ